MYNQTTQSSMNSSMITPDYQLEKYNITTSPYISLWGSGVHQSGITFHNIMTVVSIFSFISTAATCLSSPLEPFAYWSCAFSSMSFIMTFLLNILLGIDLLFPVDKDAGPKELYIEMARHYTKNVKATTPKSHKKLVSNAEKFANLFQYEVYDDRKCLSVDVSKLSLGLLSNARETVCVTPLGVQKMNKPHSMSGTRLRKGISKQLGKKYGLHGDARKQLSLLFSNMGSAGRNVAPAMADLTEAYLSSVTKSSGAHVDITHKSELLFSVALELL